MAGPESYARELSEALVVAGQKVASGRVTIRRRLRTVLNESGWLKRSSTNVVTISEALAAGGVYPDVDLTDLDLPLAEWVRLSDTPVSEREVSHLAITEKALNRFLSKYSEAVFSEIADLRDLEFVASEKRVRFGGQERRIDLVFRDKDGTLVAVELERGDPKENSAFQLRRYIEALGARGDDVRGILITARPRSAQLEEDVLTELREIPYPTAWYWYDANITLARLDG